MDTKFFSTFCFQSLECFKNLLGSHTIFCISRVIHDIIADLEYSARIVTAADHFWDISDSSLYTFNMSDIIKVDDSTNLICIFKLFFRCIIGREHDVTLFASDCFGHHQFCHGRAVTSASILLKNFDQKWIRSCFYSEEFFETFVPCKCFFYCSGILTDAFFIIKMKRCRKLFVNLLEFLQGDKWYFFHNNLLSSYFLCICVYK